MATRYRAERGPVPDEEIARIVAELVSAGFATARQLDDDVARIAAVKTPWWKRWWTKVFSGTDDPQARG